MKRQWVVYMLLCSDNSYYTGITTDIGRRMKEHNSKTRCSKYVRSRKPFTLAYVGGCGSSRSWAQKIERNLKKSSHKDKEELSKFYFFLKDISQNKTKQLDSYKKIYGV